jgi:hypothetical protein
VSLYLFLFESTTHSFFAYKQLQFLILFLSHFVSFYFFQTQNPSPSFFFVYNFHFCLSIFVSLNL